MVRAARVGGAYQCWERSGECSSIPSDCVLVRNVVGCSLEPVKQLKRLREPFHACLRICTLCTSATQRNSEAVRKGITHLCPQCLPHCYYKAPNVCCENQVMFSVLLHFFMPGPFNLAAVLNCEGYRRGCLGNALPAWAVREMLIVVPV